MGKLNDSDFHNVDSELPHFLSQIIDIHINWNDEKEVDNFHDFKKKFNYISRKALPTMRQIMNL